MSTRGVCGTCSAILFLVSFLVCSSAPFSATRGVQVVSIRGERIDLYKDYHAVVIGVSHYEYRPKSPCVLKDA